MTTFKITNPEDFVDEPVANIWLRQDGQGCIDIVVNDQVVAFFNAKGELWLVNFPEEEVDDLKRVGIQFEPGRGENEGFFVLKIR